MCARAGAQAVPNGSKVCFFLEPLLAHVCFCWHHAFLQGQKTFVMHHAWLGRLDGANRQKFIGALLKRHASHIEASLLSLPARSKPKGALCSDWNFRELLKFAELLTYFLLDVAYPQPRPDII